MSLRTCHLFAGIGGGLLADLILGHTPVVAVEWDKYACQVLRERAAEGWFPDLSVWEGDVRMFDPSEYQGKVDCIHAGFPCQDISVAGKQAGVGEETRSGLYREVLRIAGVVRPKYLFLENVAAIVSNGLDTVVGDLIKLGYDSEWLCLRASDCGANHHRDRWWLLGHAKDDGHIPRSIEAEEFKLNQAPASGASVLAYSSSVRLQVAERESRTRTERQPDGHAIELHGESWWVIEPALGRVANGIPNRVGQLKGYGNAQVPLQAAVAWKLLGGE